MGRQSGDYRSHASSSRHQASSSRRQRDEDEDFVNRPPPVKTRPSRRGDDLDDEIRPESSRHATSHRSSRYREEPPIPLKLVRREPRPPRPPRPPPTYYPPYPRPGRGQYNPPQEAVPVHENHGAPWWQYTFCICCCNKPCMLLFWVGGILFVAVFGGILGKKAYDKAHPKPCPVPHDIQWDEQLVHRIASSDLGKGLLVQWPEGLSQTDNNLGLDLEEIVKNHTRGQNWTLPPQVLSASGAATNITARDLDLMPRDATSGSDNHLGTTVAIALAVVVVVISVCLTVAFVASKRGGFGGFGKRRERRVDGIEMGGRRDGV